MKICRAWIVLCAAGFAPASAASVLARPASARGQSVADAPGPGQGLLGMRLPAAENTDFFTFFRLAETARESDAAGREVAVFKPTGGAFRKLVTVRVTVGTRDEITEVGLELARSFIDSPTNRQFASDIAKSMLESSPPFGDVAALRSLAAEIQQRQRPGKESVDIVLGHPPPLPAKISPGYLAYAGTRDSYEQKLAKTILKMDGVDEGGERWLRIRFVPRRPRKS